MTPAQTKLYGRIWGRVCRACNWRMERGRLSPKARHVTLVDAMGEGAELAAQVVHLADRHARDNSRAVTPEDLRRACIGVVTGRFQSAKDLDNRQLDRLFALFRILIDPDDLNAIIAWSSPEAGERKRLLVSIRNMAPAAYTGSILEDRWGVNSAEDLEMAELRQLANTLRARSPKWPKEHALADHDNCPF